MKISEIPSEQGMATVIDGRPVAVYNDQGEIRVFENVCTHRGCQTDWNQAEGTWDCPCHGSRYSALGDVIRGPARRSLPVVAFVVEAGELKLAA